MNSVSVIIPTFNRAEYLERAVQSVFCQNECDVEIIIIDDGSTDDTQKIVEKLNRKYPVIYIHTENSGPAAARNRGVELASSDTLAFLDSDDHWHKDKLLKQLAMMKKNPCYNICHTGEKWLRRGEHLNQKNIHKPRHGYIFDHCLQLCAVGMSTVMIKRKLFEDVGGFDISLPCCEDYDLWLRISKDNHFLLVPEPLTIKEGGRDDQVSFQYRIGMDKFRIFALQKLLTQEQLTHEQFEITKKELQKKSRIYGTGCIKHGRGEEGQYYLGLAEKYT